MNRVPRTIFSLQGFHPIHIQSAFTPTRLKAMPLNWLRTDKARTLQEHPTLLSRAPDAPSFDIATQRREGEPPLLICVQHERCTVWQLGRICDPDVS